MMPRLRLALPRSIYDDARHFNGVLRLVHAELRAASASASGRGPTPGYLDFSGGLAPALQDFVDHRRQAFLTPDRQIVIACALAAPAHLALLRHAAEIGVAGLLLHEGQIPGDCLPLLDAAIVVDGDQLFLAGTPAIQSMKG